MFAFLIISFLFLIILSGITSLPLSVAFVSSVSVIYKNPMLFFIVFLLGLFLDLLNLRYLGQTSLFLVILVLLIWLYEKKFETKTVTFVLISSFFGSLIYLKIFEGNFMFLTALVNSMFAFLLFKILIQSEILKQVQDDN